MGSDSGKCLVKSILSFLMKRYPRILLNVYHKTIYIIKLPKKGITLRQIGISGVLCYKYDQTNVRRANKRFVSLFSSKRVRLDFINFALNGYIPNCYKLIQFSIKTKWAVTLLYIYNI